MKKNKISLFISIAILLGFGFSECTSINDPTTDPSPNPEEPTASNIIRKDIELEPEETQIALRQCELPIKLLASAYKTERNANVMISPFSAAMVLGMMTNAIDPADRNELFETLNINSEELDSYNKYAQKLMASMPQLDPSSTLIVNNGFWLNTTGTISSEYSSILSNCYLSEIEKFNSFNKTIYDEINGWVNEKTFGKISSIMKEEDLNLDLDEIWVNALYFKGSWLQKFDKEQTEKSPFYFSYPNAFAQDVDMMVNDGLHYFHYFTPEGAMSGEVNIIKTVMLPFGNESFIFLAVLPSENNPGIDETLDKLTPEYWDTIDGILNRGKGMGYLTVKLPKINYNKETNFIPLLQEMGLTNIFESVSMKSNLDFIDQKICIFRQKNILELDEEGSEVGSSTAGAGMITWGGSESEQNIILFNRPFIYFVRERSTGTVLLAGVYSHP